MTGVATAIAGSAVIGGVVSSRAASKAADAAEKGGEQSIAFQREALQLQNQQSQPYREAGYTALNDLMGLVGLDAPASVQNAATGGDAALGSGSSFGNDGFDPNAPMSESQVIQAYRDVLGRDPDAGGLRYYLNESPKRGGGRNWGVTLATGGLFGKDSGKRGAFTFNQFLKATQGSSEYLEKKEAGTLPPSQEGGRYSQNYKPKSWDIERVRNAPAAPGTTGGSALSRNEQIAERVKSDPSYQFRLNEGTNALEASAAARGGFGTGLNRKMTRYAQDYASTEYQNIVNRVASIAGVGMQAQQNYGAAVQNSANQMSQTAQNTAFTRASGYTAQGNAINNAIGQGMQAYGYYNANRGGVTAPTTPPPTGGGGGMGGGWSDRRLKSNIEKIGHLEHNGLSVYSYTIFGKQETGVMAQEVIEVMPEAVIHSDNGYLAVNYDMIGWDLPSIVYDSKETSNASI